MAERFVDAAITNAGAHQAFFFIADQYVTYDYNADRVLNGVHALAHFPAGAATGFPAAFAPEGPDTRIEASLSGRAPFDGLDYYFAGGRYMRFSQADNAFVPPDSQDIAAWNMPAAFSIPDAAFNGSLNRDGFAYFFKGGNYLRYIWASDQVDVGYPKPIGNMLGVIAPFTGGLDAAVDGAGAFAEASYMFKDENYLRFQWVAAGEPHATGGSEPILGNWPGLAELLLAGKAKSSALVWLGRANGLLAGLLAGVLGPADLALVTAALATHFHLAPGDARIPAIAAMFGQVTATLRDSAHTFRYRTDAEATADGMPNIDAAYASFGGQMSFTRNFVTRPLLNRVSVMIHEAVHVHDALSGTPDTHISEWYLTAPAAAFFGIPFQLDRPPSPTPPHLPDMATRYDLMPPDNAIHNPSSYATFARHVTIGDSRELP